MSVSCELSGRGLRQADHSPWGPTECGESVCDLENFDMEQTQAHQSCRSAMRCGKIL